MPQSSDPPNRDSRFAKLLAGLAQARVDFAVAGGLAVILNGYERLTLDVDILVNDSSENLQKLLDHLANWGEGWAREVKLDDFNAEEGAVRIEDEFDLDIFTRMRGHSLEDFRARLRFLEIGDARVPYLAPEDLIELKRDSWRDKDKLDVAALREIIELEKREQKESE